MSRLSLATARTVWPLSIAEIRAHLLLNSSAGEPAPTAPTVALVSASGNITAGVHRWLWVFRTADGSTEAGAVSAPLTTILATAGQVTVTKPIGGSAVTYCDLYRTAANGSTYLLVIASQANDGIAYTDNIADGSLGVAAPSTNTTNDPELTTWLQAATSFVETYTHRQTTSATWDLKLDAFPCGDCITIPKSPLVSVTSVTYTDTNGDAQTVSASNYTVVAPSGLECAPGYIVPAYGVYWPVTRAVPNAVVVRFVAGYGVASTVPAPIRAAMKLLIGHWYANREAVNIGNITSELPLAVASLLWPYKAFDGVAV